MPYTRCTWKFRNKLQVNNSAKQLLQPATQSTSQSGYFSHQHLMHYATASCGMSLHSSHTCLGVSVVGCECECASWGLSHFAVAETYTIHSSCRLASRLLLSLGIPLPERDCKSSGRAHALNKINGTLSI